MRCAWGFLVLLGACVGSDALQCPNGETCPGGTACDTAHGGCVQPSQLTSCDGLGDGMSCGITATDDGICDQGVCIVETCGDGYVRGGEECDGDVVPDEANCTDMGFYLSQKPACTADCTFDRASCSQECGDGELQPQYEICETNTPVTATCVDYGFGAGPLGCINCGPETSACIPFGWDVEYIGAAITSIGGTSANDVWATISSTQGSLQHYDGTSWSAVDLSTCGFGQNEYATRVSVIGGGAVFLATSSRAALRSGTTCTTYQLPDTITALWASSASDAWVSIESDGLYHFDGASWTRKYTFAAFGEQAARMWGSGPNDVYEVTFGATLMHWNGAAWSPVVPGNVASVASVWGTASNDVYVSGAASDQTAIIARWNGSGWTTVFADSGLLPGSSSVQAGQKVGNRQYILGVVSSTQRYVMLYNDGNGWVSLGAPVNDNVPFFAADDGSVFAWLGSTPNTLHMRGTTRTDITGWPRDTITQIAGSSIDDLFLSTYNGTLYHFDGAAWAVDGAFTAKDLSRSPSGTLFGINDSALGKRAPGGTWQTDGSVAGSRISAVSDTDAWIVAMPSTLLHWHGGTVDTFDIPGEINDVWAASSTDVFLSGEDLNGPAVLRFNGATFTPMTLPALVGVSQITDLVANSATDIYALNTGGTLLHYDGTAWTLVEGMTQINAVWGTANDLFVGTYTGLMHYDGTAWNPVATAYPVGVLKLMGVGDTLFIFDYFERMHSLVRIKPW